MSSEIFHLAIPCKDVDEAAEFYEKRLGCGIGRKYAAYVTVDFFGHQVVCHLDREAYVENPQMYPRHFGMTFEHRADFDRMLEKAKKAEVPFFQELMTRYKGKPEEHHTFFLKDPTNNLIEFKTYEDPKMMR